MPHSADVRQPLALLASCGARVLHPEIFYAVVQKRLDRAMEDSMFSNLLWRLKKVS